MSASYFHFRDLNVNFFKNIISTIWMEVWWIRYHLTPSWGFPGGSDYKGSAYNMGDPGLIPGLGRSPGKEHGNPLEYSCLEKSMDRGAWQATVHGVTKSRTRLSDFTFTVHFHALEKEMATHSSVLAWRIPWTEELGGLQSTGSQRVRHDWATSLSLSINLYSQSSQIKDENLNPDLHDFM